MYDVKHMTTCAPHCSPMVRVGSAKASPFPPQQFHFFGELKAVESTAIAKFSKYLQGAY